MGVEDFTTYTEVDPNNKITVTSTKCDINSLSAGDTAYVRKDAGVGHFGDFEHLTTVRVDSSSEQYASFGFWSIANTYNTTREMSDHNNDIFAYVNIRNGNVRIGLEDAEAQDSDYTNAPLVNTTYYITIKRVGTALTCKIYSDANRTNLLWTLNVTCLTTTYRYIFGFINYGYGPLLNTGFTENLDLQEAPPPPAHFMQPRKYW